MTERYNEYDFEYVRKRLGHLTAKEIVWDYNKNHRVPISVHIIRKYAYSNDLSFSSVQLLKKQIVKEWVCDNAHTYSSQQKLVDALNERFKTHVSCVTFRKHYGTVGMVKNAN